MSEIKKNVTIQNIKGLHARAAYAMVKLSENFDAEVVLCKDGLCADAGSTMDLMMLTAHKGSNVELSASGKEAEQAIEAISKLIEDKFNENE